MTDTNFSEIAGDNLFGPGGHFDVRGRKAVRQKVEEENIERLAREASAGLSRLELAQVAAEQRRGLRQLLPNEDDVTLPWLFDQVVSELEAEDTQMYTTTGASKLSNDHEIKAEDEFLKLNDDNFNKNIPWWKKRKEEKITASLSDIFQNKDVDYQEEVYRHRFSHERVHDPESKVYSDLDKAASMMELREAVVKQTKRTSQHPHRDSAKRIIKNPYAVGSDERMYDYHFWGDRSIEISAPAADVLSVVRDDLKVHVDERFDRKEHLEQQVKDLEDDLILAKHTKTNIYARWEERRKWYEQQLEATKKAENVRADLQGGLEEQKRETRKEIFCNVQLEILFHRDRARYLGEPQCHKCVRAFFYRCCNTGKTCCGKRTQDPDQKGCCFHCCSTCWDKNCINKFDIDTHLNEMRSTEEIFRGCPMKCMCCCCWFRTCCFKCDGGKFVKVKKPEYLRYEDDPFSLYKDRVIEFEMNLTSSLQSLDPSGGEIDGKKKKKKKKRTQGFQAETGQGKE